MARWILLLAVAACGSKDPHAAGTCDTGWTQNGFEECELACEDSNTALLASGPACNALTIDNATVSCSTTFVFEDVQGCCATDGIAVSFAECQ
jgi:hypothetical protein